ncbi:unnamed protein product [Clonostachys rosea]|uniref:Pectate lyase n=1 Tax=Bionectria ochroleuca TaxID=29856 RepID=A0ABY6UJ75_BIOOC|nr:unnamed protein product [Clonostachys rosea]
MFSPKVLCAIAALPAAMACLGYDGGLPKHTGTKTLSAPQYIGAGETFDAGWVKYDRGSGACKEQAEGGEADTVFVLREGATLRNVIIGKNQAEGVYCLGSCNLEFVWFEDVCEDAISIKGSGTANIIGGGAFKAADKVIQHNGCGHVNIINFYANDYGKVYRSCGNCKNNCARSVHMEGTTGVNGGELIGINTNLGDKATYSNNCYPGTQCQGYNGCDKANGECEPTKASKC